MLKRALDLTLVLAAAPIWLTALLIIGVLTRLKMGSPVFFVQERPGLHGKVFKLIKFRTMTARSDDRKRVLPDADRLTSYGAWMRSLSLDELPELIHVLRGEMSLVGPRPLLPEYLDRYSSRQARRHEALPGLTGWAQVNGRNLLSWEERLEMDVWYVDHRGFWLDVKILALTAVKILKREGIQGKGSATMPEFQGREPLKR